MAQAKSEFKRLPVDELLGEGIQETGKQENHYAEDEIVQDDSFSYKGYQVVRGEFFAHLYEPAICFNRSKVYVNMGCLKRMQDVSYVQILVNAEEKKLVIRPAGEDEKDAFLWCTEKNGARKPKQITCRVFFAKIINLMSWNADYRYKLLGKVIRSGEEKLVVFDLNATEIYLRTVKDGQKPRTSRNPVFPAEWENQFGLPVEEHRKQLQVNIFKGYTVFGIQESKPGKTPEESGTGGDA
jgi:hypothetical protein